jgi:hypothetical protein
VTAKPTEKLKKSTLPHPARRALPSPARRDFAFAAPPVARFAPTKAVGSFVPSLTRKAFEKFGFSTATLLTDWAQIAGAELASYTVPDRLKWPRGGSAEGDELEPVERRGATLVLRVDPARALDVEYRARQILERINAYFGYRAVETIRLVQAPLDCPAQTPAVALPSASIVTPAKAGDDPLAAALARLERGVLGDRTTRRT